MLAHEWRELEMLCEHLGELDERRAAARKTGNTGLVEGLDAEMKRVMRQRELLVQHISTRLGSAAGDCLPSSGTIPRAGADRVRAAIRH
jgi:hypothetical protein